MYNWNRLNPFKSLELKLVKADGVKKVEETVDIQ